MENQELDFSFVFGSAVHDIKNSVGLLLNSLGEFIDEHPPADSQEGEKALVLNYEASRINNDLMQLLSIYRLNNDKLSFTVEEQLVRDFIEDELVAHETLTRMKGIDVSIECDDQLIWYFDAMLMRTVFTNILVNTVRYTKGRILIKTVIENDLLCISIEDDGEGYPEHLRNDPGGYLGRIDYNTGSTGLGLYFSAKVAQLHKNGNRQGRIEVDNNSSLGGGAFRIYIP